MTRIFVYGTLRRGMVNYAPYLEGKSTFLREAYVKGTLYTLKHLHYPALVAGDDYILGEIFEVEDKFIPEMDAMEEYYGEDDERNLYHKRFLDIYDEHHHIIDKLPVYFYNLDRKDLKDTLDYKIVEGDFTRHIKEQSVHN